MLSLQLKSGEYLTIGGDVVVQIFKESGPQFRVSVKAPREVPILRGEVLERGGQRRPEGLLTKGPKRPPSDQLRSAQRLRKRSEQQAARRREAEAVSAAADQMRALLDAWEERAPEAGELQAFRACLSRVEALAADGPELPGEDASA